jgi:copper chaperone CopZ
VSFAKKEAVVTVERRRLDRAALVQAVDKVGYRASVKTAPTR